MIKGGRHSKRRGEKSFREKKRKFFFWEGPKKCRQKKRTGMAAEKATYNKERGRCSLRKGLETAGNKRQRGLGGGREKSRKSDVSVGRA